MRDVLYALIFAGAISAPASASETARLDDQAIRTLVVGKTLLGQYPDGTPWRETFFVDEGTDYQDPDYRLRGTWYARDDALCTIYDDAGELEGGCFLVVKRSQNCVEFYATGTNGEPTQSSRNDMELGINWTARGWRSDKPSTCPDGLTS